MYVRNIVTKYRKKSIKYNSFPNHYSGVATINLLNEANAHYERNSLQ